MYLRAAKCLL